MDTKTFASKFVLLAACLSVFLAAPVVLAGGKIGGDPTAPQIVLSGGKVGGDPTRIGTLLANPDMVNDPVGAVPCRDGAWTKNGDAVYQCVAGAWQYVAPGSMTQSRPEQDPKKCVWTCWKDEYGTPICMGNGPQCNNKCPPGWC